MSSLAEEQVIKMIMFLKEDNQLNPIVQVFSYLQSIEHAQKLFFKVKSRRPIYRITMTLRRHDQFKQKATAASSWKFREPSKVKQRLIWLIFERLQLLAKPNLYKCCKFHKVTPN